MTRKQRPADDRASDDLKTWEVPATDSNQPASCPLLSTIKLLPLRYGRTETPSPESESGLPYELTSRPLGYRLLRDGYIYVLDEDVQTIHEYVHQDGELSGHNGGKLEYPKDHTLYVCFSDIALTERKKAQVLDSKDERAFFMQKIDLSSASPASGGVHLLTPEQAKLWVAEFAEDFQPEAPEGGYAQESEPYYWENQPYYHKTRFGKLIRQQDIEDPSDCLCLVLRDDVGVMLDLAQHQNDVVGWLDEWAESGEKQGDTERDYVLGAVIESMTMVDRTAILGLLKQRSDKKILQDIEGLEQTKREETLVALTSWLNADSGDGRAEGPSSQNHPPALEAKLDEIRGEASQTNYYDIVNRLNWTTEDYYTRDALSQLDQGFVNKHIATIKEIKKAHNESLKGALSGVGLGKQGINELIDRPRMETFMSAQRTKLARWQSELALITEDRATLLCDNRYHHAAWYFDLEDEAQIEAALTLEYQCMKDVCRTDNVSERVATWMQEYPQYTRPMFHTLSLADQSPGIEPMTTYAAILGAGYSVVAKAKEYANSLRNAEAGRLPVLGQMSENIRMNAAAVGDALSPAISMSMAETMQQLYRGLDADSLPSLDKIFRDIPFFLKGSMLDAARSGEIEFKIASSEDLNAFKANLHKIMQLNNQLHDISSQRDQVKISQGHRSEQAKRLLDQFHSVRDEQRVVGERMAHALSPIDETEGRISLAPSGEANGKAALSLILPATEQREVGRVMQQLRKGAAAVPEINKLGDGIGVAIFFVQLANLGSALAEYQQRKNAFGNGQRSFLPVVEASFGSSAAGFSLAQGVADSALGARAKQLAMSWKQVELTSVHAQMGRLHTGLGVVAYLTGFTAAAFSVNKHHNNWLSAIKSGNHEAEIAATMAMIGSGGMVATNAAGFVSSIRTFTQVASASRAAAKQIGGNAVEARAAAWATAGTRLTALFARLNFLGLAFTVIELGATGYYNYVNRSQRDEWLSSTPWSSDQSKNKKLSRDDYIESLERTNDSLSLTQNEESEGETQGFYLNCYGLPGDALRRPLNQKPPYKLSIACWRIQPETGWIPFSKKPEVWDRSTAPVLNTIRVNESANYLQIGFSSPPHEETRHGIKTSELALMVKVESLQPEGSFIGTAYMLWIKPDSKFPIFPVQEPPKDSLIWRELDWPDMPLEAVI